MMVFVYFTILDIYTISFFQFNSNLHLISIFWQMVLASGFKIVKSSNFEKLYRVCTNRYHISAPQYGKIHMDTYAAPHMYYKEIQLHYNCPWSSRLVIQYNHWKINDQKTDGQAMLHLIFLLYFFSKAVSFFNKNAYHNLKVTLSYEK